MAAETKIDPMHQFQIDPIAGQLVPGNPFVFTNSALWMLILLALITAFMLAGIRRDGGAERPPSRIDPGRRTPSSCRPEPPRRGDSHLLTLGMKPAS